MPLLKPFRALRYDVAAAGPVDRLVAPPHDVITPEARTRLLAASPYNVVRLIRPHEHDVVAETFAAWQESGVLVRERVPAVWLLEEDFTGPDGVARTRRGLVARVRLEPYSSGVVLPHERTFPGQKEVRLRLLHAVRTKLSPIFLLHEGAGPPPAPGRDPDLEAELDGVRSRLWRLAEPRSMEAAIEAVQGRLIIADGHHRYETALRFHEEEGTEETAHALAVLISRDDDGLSIFPTHRLLAGPVPELNGAFRLTPLAGDLEAVVGRLATVGRDHPAFVLLRTDGAVLAEREAVGNGPLDLLDTAAIDTLDLRDVSFTPSAAEAEGAVRSGAARAALLVRAPTVEQVEAVALAGETMPEKSTYFFPKLTSGLLFSPFDE